MALYEFGYRAAWVLPFTKWKKQGPTYFILGREAYGPDAKTWDAFGGRRDNDELHSVVTAAREFVEETMQLIYPNTKRAIGYIDPYQGNTSTIVANRAKRGVTYVTYFHHSVLEMFTENFFDVRQKLKQRKDTEHLIEKDGIAWITARNLKYAIVNAARDQNGKLILPVLARASVLQRDGRLLAEEISLRPILVDMLQSYFARRNNYKMGKHPTIRFYDY